MKQIEDEANTQIGVENAKNVLLPFTSILNPIMKILNIHVKKGGHSSNDSSKDARQENQSQMTGWGANTVKNDEIGMTIEQHRLLSKGSKRGSQGRNQEFYKNAKLTVIQSIGQNEE